MLEGTSTSDLLMYAGIFVLALALIVLVLWVSRISSSMTALKQALMIDQRKLEELERQLGVDVGHLAAAASSSDIRRKIAMRSAAGAEDPASTGEMDLSFEYAGEASTGSSGIGDAQFFRQQEQMQRISRARERQAKLKRKHSEEMSAELRRKREMARQREEQVRSFQQQQDALRQRMALEQAEIAAEEERLNKLRTRASWSGSGAAGARPRQRVSTARLEERRQAQLRRQAEEIIQTRLGNAGETNYFGNSADLR